MRSMKIHGIEIDSFTLAYIQCALWAETDGDEPLDRNYDITDLEPTSIQRMQDDCARFQTENDCSEIREDPCTAGHNFWLTRNRHGAGFWDGDYPEELGKALTETSHHFGECNLIVSDHGALCLYPM